MAELPKALTLWIVGVGCLVFLLSIVTDRRPEPETLARDIRSGLPAGSSLATVIEFLNKRAIESSFDAPSGTLYAIRRDMKGSTILTGKSLALELHFDSALNLKSINTRVLFTGP